MLLFGKILVIFQLTLQVVSDIDSEKLLKTGRIDGDFQVAAIFPIHGLQNETNHENAIQCNDLRNFEGIQLVEAAFYAIDAINRDNNLLPKIKLGIMIKDECWSDLAALHQTIKLLEVAPYTANDLRVDEDICLRKSNTSLIGLIGTASTSSTTLVQNLLKLFRIPQIGYSNTAIDLKHPYFLFNVIPSIYHEALVIINIMRKFKWNYISTAYTTNYFGITGRYYLQEWARYFNVCTAAHVHIPHPRKDGVYKNALKELFKDKRAKVIVCFCEEFTIVNLFKAIKEHNLTGKLMIIGINDRLTGDLPVDGYEEQARGSIMIGIRRNHLPKFDEYFLRKNLTNNKRNPWFEEFWEHQFRCKIHSGTNFSICTGNEDLRETYQQSSKVSYVVKSVYAFAYALHYMNSEQCGIKPCSPLYPFNSTKYMEYLKTLNFSFYQEYVDFGLRGTPTTAYYDVFNFQKLNDSYKYVKISEYCCDYNKYDEEENVYWHRFTDFSDLQLPGGRSSFKSSCSAPCQPGQIKQNYLREDIIADVYTACCWSCRSCKPDEIVKENTCVSCSYGYWPSTNRTVCRSIPKIYKQWTPFQFYFAKALSVFGIILTLLTTYVFIKYRNTPVVKSSTRELCYIILVGVLMHHGTIFVSVAKPTLVTCFLLRACPTMSYTLVFGALLIKTNRIARLLAISRRKFPNLNPRFMTLQAQIVLVFMLITVQVILSAINLTIWPASLTEELNKENVTDVKFITRCHLSPEAGISCAVYNLILMFLCSYYAYKTRNIPDNFNEAKFIGFLAYITTLTCIACTLIYYGSRWKMLSVGIGMSVNGFNVLIFLFFPKLFIILWAPERNTREYFATATGIRCIIGRKDIITSEILLKKKFIRKDLENFEDLYSLQFSSTTTKETSDETT